jgi:hypothetical protein
VLRHAIDQALQSVMARVYAQQGLGRCATYAIVGAQVLTRLLDHPYQPVCGGQVTDAGNGMYIVFYPPRDQRRRARQLGDMVDYHCWVQAWRAVPGQKKDRVEIVDFAARHDPASAAMVGVPFTRPPQDFVWDWADVLNRHFPDSLRSHPEMRKRKPAWMWVDAELTTMLHAMRDAQPDYYRQLSDAVIGELAKMVDAMDALRHTLLPQALRLASPVMLPIAVLAGA